MKAFVYLVAGGAAGTLARVWLAAAIQRASGSGFPYGTLAVNVSGCFLIGVFAALAASRPSMRDAVSLALMGGFCGAYTTLSTFVQEIVMLSKGGQTGQAAVYALGTFAAGVAVFLVGYAAGTRA